MKSNGTAIRDKRLGCAKIRRTALSKTTSPRRGQPNSCIHLNLVFFFRFISKRNAILLCRCPPRAARRFEFDWLSYRRLRIRNASALGLEVASFSRVDIWIGRRDGEVSSVGCRVVGSPIRGSDLHLFLKARTSACSGGKRMLTQRLSLTTPRAPGVEVGQCRAWERDENYGSYLEKEEAHWRETKTVSKRKVFSFLRRNFTALAYGGTFDTVALSTKYIRRNFRIIFTLFSTNLLRLFNYEVSNCNWNYALQRVPRCELFTFSMRVMASGGHCGQSMNWNCSRFGFGGVGESTG